MFELFEINNRPNLIVETILKFRTIEIPSQAILDTI